jgi:hypothetical protein
MAQLTYDRASVTLAAALTDHQLVAPGIPVNSIVIAQLNGAVTLSVRFGTKPYWPNLVQGQGLEFPECDDELGGLFVSTVGTSATDLIIMFAPRPVAVN